jgi:hypothetical protein
MTDRFLIGNRPIYFTHWEDGQMAGRFEATRIACSSAYGLGNGMFYGLYTDSPMCNCIRQAMSGVSAYTSDGRTIDGEPESQEDSRLRKGPAAAPEPASAPAEQDWPMYRRDMRRGAGTAGTIPAKLAILWRKKLPSAPNGAPAAGDVLHNDWRLNKVCGDPVSAPTVAGGKVFVSLTHAQQVVALGETTGQVAWRFLAPARLDTPPTIHRGLCLFGCSDGWVYCLRADDGKLVWRFRAAPTERRIVAYGQVESAWPVVGGVMTVGDLAYAVAGRTTEVDGGLYVYALKPRTGKVVWSGRRVKPDDGPVGAWNLSGNRNEYFGPADILCSDGKHLAIAGHDHGRFDCKTGERISGSRFHVHFGWMRSQYSGTNRGTEYPPLAYAQGRSVRTRWTRDKKTKKRHCFIAMSEKPGWKVEVLEPTEYRVEALALAGDVVLAAVSRAGPQAGGELWLLAGKDGARLATHKLPAAPAFDAVAIANGEVYVALQDGAVLCLGDK